MDNATQLPLYRSHKLVRAAKIDAIITAEEGSSVMYAINFEGIEAHAMVTPEWMVKRMPQVGGYYVVYCDGYSSYSPSAAFEDGYTREIEHG